MEAITEAINLIENDNLQLIENDSQKMTYFSFPTKEDVNVFLKNGKRFY